MYISLWRRLPPLSRLRNSCVAENENRKGPLDESRTASYGEAMDACCDRSRCRVQMHSWLEPSQLAVELVCAARTDGNCRGARRAELELVVPFFALLTGKLLFQWCRGLQEVRYVNRKIIFFKFVKAVSRLYGRRSWKPDTVFIFQHFSRSTTLHVLDRKKFNQIIIKFRMQMSRHFVLHRSQITYRT